MSAVFKVALIGTCLFGALVSVSNHLEAFINAPKTVQNGQQETNKYISRSEAEEISLKDAGIKENTTTYLNTEFNYNETDPVYRVEMMVGENEFVYDIDAETGNIISKGYDINGTSNSDERNNVKVQFSVDGSEYEYNYDMDSSTGNIHNIGINYN